VSKKQTTTKQLLVLEGLMAVRTFWYLPLGLKYFEFLPMVAVVCCADGKLVCTQPNLSTKLVCRFKQNKTKTVLWTPNEQNQPATQNQGPWRP
jgi:hypothetical protein